MSEDLQRDDKLMRRLLERYRVTSGDTFDLDRFATDDLPDEMPCKREAKALLGLASERMGALQELLYANATWSLLVVLQGMDASGKDSTIKHVMSGINPQGVAVTSFKAPGPHELAHGFLWRVGRAVPARGMIGLFNRSHYEDVLVARVHPEMLARAGLPQALAEDPRLWEHRIADIAAFEGYLTRQGTRIVKVFLNLGRDEQKKRFLARLEEPEKLWKFDAGDLAERERWTDYRNAYAAAISGTATADAPWLVVPADRKWYARLLVAEAMVAALDDLGLEPPAVSESDESDLAAARRRLADE